MNTKKKKMVGVRKAVVPGQVKAPGKGKKVVVERKVERGGLSPLEELEQETRTILRLKGEIAQKFWDLGKAMDKVLKGRLYLEKGFDTFEEYLEKEVVIGRSTAFRLIDLSRKFSRETAYLYGQEKLLGAIAYAKATPVQDRPIDVTRYEIEVIDKSGKVSMKPFADASGKEIKRAADRLKRRQKRELEKAPVARLFTPASSGKVAEGVGAKVESFVSRAREMLGVVKPGPVLEVSVDSGGGDPEVSLSIAGVRVSRLVEVLRIVARAAGEAMR